MFKLMIEEFGKPWKESPDEDFRPTFSIERTSDTTEELEEEVRKYFGADLADVEIIVDEKELYVGYSFCTSISVASVWNYRMYFVSYIDMSKDLYISLP